MSSPSAATSSLMRAGAARTTSWPPGCPNTAPVANEFSAEASHATSAATSSTVTKRLRGILDSMKSICSCVI